MAQFNNQNAKTQLQDNQLSFTPEASIYAAGTVHLHDHSLQSMKSMIDTDARSKHYRWSLDLGVGAALVLAGVSNNIITSDISKSVLHQAKCLGQERKIDNLRLSQNAAEALPFTDQSVDLVSSSASAHHFRDFEKVLHEVHRVLKIGGSLLMADSVAPEQDDIASWMNNIERRRDFSHVENRKISTITNILTNNGFKVAHDDYQRVYLRFNEWTARTKVGSEEVKALRRDFLEAPNAIREAFQVAPVHGDITFPWPCWVFRATKR